MTDNINSTNENSAETVETTTTTVTEPGFFTNLYNSTTARVIAGGAAVGGLGYLAYNYFNGRAAANDLEEVVETAAAFFGGVLR